MANHVIFVGGIGEEVDEKTLMGAFSIFGDIGSLEIPTDSQSLKPRGFALIEFLDSNDAQEAIDNMDGSELFGRTLRVKFSTKRTSLQLSDPKKAVWADELYYRKVMAKPIAENP